MRMLEAEREEKLMVMTGMIFLKTETALEENGLLSLCWVKNK